MELYIFWSALFWTNLAEVPLLFVLQKHLMSFFSEEQTLRKCPSCLFFCRTNLAEVPLLFVLQKHFMSSSDKKVLAKILFAYFWGEILGHGTWKCSATANWHWQRPQGAKFSLRRQALATTPRAKKTHTQAQTQMHFCLRLCSCLRLCLRLRLRLFVFALAFAFSSGVVASANAQNLGCTVCTLGSRRTISGLNCPD